MNLNQSILVFKTSFALQFKMNIEKFKWGFAQCFIFDIKTQKKLLKLSKDLNVSDWQVLIFLETLPDVSLDFLKKFS